MRRIFCAVFLCVYLPVLSHAQIVVAPAGKEPVLKIGGLLQAQADFGERGDGRFTTADDRFYLRRARLNATGSFLEDFDFRLELDLSASLSNNSTSISTSNLRAQLTDGYITWNKYPEAYIRGGQFKSPFGYEQLYADPRLFTIERSLVNDRLTIGRQIGVMVAGDLFEKRFSYWSGVFNGNNVNVSFNDNDSFLFAGRASAALFDGKAWDQSTRWAFGGNVFLSEDKNLPGQSAEFQFPLNTFTGKRRGVGVDTQLRMGKLDLWGEYLTLRFEPEDETPREEITPEGWYLLAGYFLKSKLQLVLRYETFDPKLIASTDTWTAGVNYLIKGDDLKIQVDYLHSDVAGLPDSQQKLLVRMQVIF